MKKTLRVNDLLDFYESLLSERQKTVMDLYYREDYSLNEIAENLDISKQAVSDNIKRAIINLEKYEINLCLFKKQLETSALYENLKKELDELRLFSDEEDFQERLKRMKTLLD